MTLKSIVSHSDKMLSLRSALCLEKECNKIETQRIETKQIEENKLGDRNLFIAATEKIQELFGPFLSFNPNPTLTSPELSNPTISKEKMDALIEKAAQHSDLTQDLSKNNELLIPTPLSRTNSKKGILKNLRSSLIPKKEGKKTELQSTQIVLNQFDVSQKNTDTNELNWKDSQSIILKQKKVFQDIKKIFDELNTNNTLTRSSSIDSASFQVFLKKINKIILAQQEIRNIIDSKKHSIKKEFSPIKLQAGVKQINNSDLKCSILNNSFKELSILAKSVMKPMIAIMSNATKHGTLKATDQILLPSSLEKSKNNTSKLFLSRSSVISKYDETRIPDVVSHNSNIKTDDYHGFKIDLLFLLFIEILLTIMHKHVTDRNSLIREAIQAYNGKQKVADTIRECGAESFALSMGMSVSTMIMGGCSFVSANMAHGKSITSIRGNLNKALKRDHDLRIKDAYVKDVNNTQKQLTDLEANIAACQTSIDNKQKLLNGMNPQGTGQGDPPLEDLQKNLEELQKKLNETQNKLDQQNKQIAILEKQADEAAKYQSDDQNKELEDKKKQEGNIDDETQINEAVNNSSQTPKEKLENIKKQVEKVEEEKQKLEKDIEITTQKIEYKKELKSLNEMKKGLTDTKERLVKLKRLTSEEDVSPAQPTASDSPAQPTASDSPAQPTASDSPAQPTASNSAAPQNPSNSPAQDDLSISLSKEYPPDVLLKTYDDLKYSRDQFRRAHQEIEAVVKKRENIHVTINIAIGPTNDIKHGVDGKIKNESSSNEKTQESANDVFEKLFSLIMDDLKRTIADMEQVLRDLAAITRDKAQVAQNTAGHV